MHFQQPVNWCHIYFIQSLSISHKYFLSSTLNYSLSFLLHSSVPVYLLGGLELG